MKKQQPVIVVQGQEDWLQIENAAYNTVVQVFAQISRFNWLEPYKVSEQFENRGTGFFLNDQGYIVTNAHVVDEAKTVWINIPALGRETIHVEIIGFCPERDIALLRITKEDLERVRERLGRVPFLMLGDSDVVQRTDKILVLGHPLGQHHIKSTTGIVSGREAVDTISYIQITAPINPGSSGGPLLSTEGAVIGITVATATDVLNVGYAIPINELKVALEGLLKTSLLRKLMLGASFHNTTDDHARYLGNPVPGGLYVHNVVPGSLIDKAGVLQGDMVYEFNGHKIDSHGEASVAWSVDRVSLYDIVSTLVEGDKVNLTVYRLGKKLEISFNMEQAFLFPVRTKYPDYEAIEYEVIGGMVIMELTQNHLSLLLSFAPDLIQYRKVKQMLEPLLVVTHILPGSLAQQLRSISPGAIIKTVHDKPVKTIEEFRKVILSLAGQEYLSLKTEEEIFVVFPMNQLLADEQRLSEDFFYPISKTVLTLQRLMKNEKKNKA